MTDEVTVYTYGRETFTFPTPHANYIIHCTAPPMSEDESPQPTPPQTPTPEPEDPWTPDPDNPDEKYQENENTKITIKTTGNNVIGGTYDILNTAYYPTNSWGKIFFAWDTQNEITRQYLTTHYERHEHSTGITSWQQLSHARNQVTGNYYTNFRILNTEGYGILEMGIVTFSEETPDFEWELPSQYIYGAGFLVIGNTTATYNYDRLLSYDLTPNLGSWVYLHPDDEQPTNITGDFLVHETNTTIRINTTINYIPEDHHDSLAYKPLTYTQYRDTPTNKIIYNKLQQLPLQN